jgi:CDP-paratose 2-epimerase
MLRIAQKSNADVLITGGAGFIGANLAAHLLANTDARITIFDDLTEPGAEQNLSWLHGQAGGGRLELVRGDCRSASPVCEAAAHADEIYHLAQYHHPDERPLEERETDTAGTSSLLEAARRSGRNPVVVCASVGSRNSLLRYSGSDRLILEAARLHHMRTVLLRVDTVTGPRQFGEGHDWVARAAYAVLAGRACSLKHSSSHWHDVLHVADVVNAVLAANAYIGKTAGHAYRVSGGASHCITVKQMIQLIERIGHRGAKVEGLGRGSDDAGRPIVPEDSFRVDTSWRARRSVEETVRDIVLFWNANQQLMTVQNMVANQREERRTGSTLSRSHAA